MRKFLFVLLLTLLAAFTGCRSDELPDAAASSASDSAKTTSEASTMNTGRDESISSGDSSSLDTGDTPSASSSDAAGELSSASRPEKATAATSQKPTCGAKANGSAGTNQSAGERQRQHFLRIGFVQPAGDAVFGRKAYYIGTACVPAAGNHKPAGYGSRIRPDHP